MCGISGCLKNKTAMLAVMNALNKLQNRGYDSVGISTIVNGDLVIEKSTSNEGENAMVNINSRQLACAQCNIAIGHTRWATHGAKTISNAHPHTDDSKRYAIVHNGIIENYAELKAELLAKGYTFYGETDTEIVIKYFDYLVNSGKGFSELNQIMKGAWAILIMDKFESNRIYYMKNGSPLIVGFDDAGSKLMFVSELAGFDPDITTHFSIDDGDYGYTDLNEMTTTFHSVIKKNYTPMITPKISIETSPAPYPHWTIKEINDQPYVLTDLISNRLFYVPDNKSYELHFPELEVLGTHIKDVEHLILLACGSSLHAAQVGDNYFQKFGINVTTKVINGAEFENYNIPKNRKTIMILLSQSGETKDVSRALDIGKANGIKTIGIINVENSLIARNVDTVLYLKAGRENAVASTKSFTNQVVMLLMLALKLATNLDFDTKYKYIRALINLSDDYSKIINKAVTELPESLRQFNNQANCFILGKHEAEWIASEGSLKIKEISYIHAQGYSASELKHGAFAVLQNGYPVIMIGTNDESFSKIENVICEVKSRSARVILITNKPSFNTTHIDYMFYYPTDSILFPLLAVVPLQVLAYFLALDRKNNPDQPRNLAKVVTVE